MPQLLSSKLCFSHIAIFIYGINGKLSLAFKCSMVCYVLHMYVLRKYEHMYAICHVVLNTNLG